jgi:hypothetical protein
MRRLTHPATLIAAAALFLALGGGAAAYASGLISGSQIKNHSISEKKLTRKAIKALRRNASNGSVATKAFAGPVADVIPPQALPYSFSWIFAGPTVVVTTGATQHLVGTAAAVLGSTSGAEFDFVLCYQKNARGGEVHNFVGPDYLTADATHLRFPYTASASVVPGAGTWKVGFCVVNEGPSSLNDNDFVNGWVQAVN